MPVDQYDRDHRRFPTRGRRARSGGKPHDPQWRHLQLYLGSPAIDAGINAANIRPTDIRSAARIQNGTIDLGAYEGGVELLDSDNDGLSDEFEFANTTPASTTGLSPTSNLEGDPGG